MCRSENIKKQIETLQNELDGLSLIETMSLRNFGKLVGLSPTTVLKVRRGEDVSLMVLKKVLPHMEHCPCCKQPMQPLNTTPETTEGK